MELKNYKGVLVRKDYGNDKTIVNECLKNYTHFKMDENSTVLDLGGHIGGFGVLCRNANVKKYVAYEADAENFEVLTANMNGFDRAELNHSAVSALKDDHLTFYIRPSKQSKCSSTICPSKVNKGMTRVDVKNTYIEDVFSKYEPTHVKMDIEGAEKDILVLWNNQVPRFIKQLAIEIHAPGYVKQFEDVIHPEFVKQGLKLIHASPVHGFINKGKQWDHFGHSHTSVLFGFDLLYVRNEDNH